MITGMEGQQQSCCFLCLNSKVSPPVEEAERIKMEVNRWTIFRYLDVKLAGELEGMEGFCWDCEQVTGKMETLCRELDNCVEVLRRRMEEAEEDPERLTKELEGMVGEVRRMTKEKCVPRWRKRKVTKIEEELVVKQEVIPEGALVVSDLKTEWNGTEIEEEINLEDLGVGEPLFEPEEVEESSIPEDILEEKEETPEALTLPPPPPPVNIPRKTKQEKEKKKKVTKVTKTKVTTEGDGLKKKDGECPVDFYFHRKVDNRHACPFCQDTSPTLTNLRFHVIRAHPEELFAPSRLETVNLQDFKAQVELMLFTVTKEAETGERNASGTKVIVQCGFCGGDGKEENEETPRIYHDKRAFQCHLILNHYMMLTQRLLDMQRLEVPSCLEEAMEVDAQKKPRRSWVYKLNSKKHKGDLEVMSPQKKHRKMEDNLKVDNDGGGVKVTNFPCEHCGKALSSSTSRWRHKQQYCEVLRSRGEIGGGKGKISEVDPMLILDEEEEGTSSSLSLNSGDGDGGSGGELEMLLKEQQDLNDILIGKCDLDEYPPEFGSSFGEFYNEDEVNDVLLTMMMESSGGMVVNMDQLQ